MQAQASERLRQYWRHNLNVTAVLMALWSVVTFVVIYFARELSFSFFGWPSSFYMAAQGALFVYLLIVWYYARHMNALDHEYGVDEAAEARSARRSRGARAAGPAPGHDGLRIHAVTILRYAGIGIMSRTNDAAEHCVAGPPRAGHARRHGDRRRPDIGGLVRRPGRRPVPAGLFGAGLHHARYGGHILRCYMISTQARLREIAFGIPARRRSRARPARSACGSDSS
jgi:putative solute:sodium symporter small subunit